jgi:hypothetical protein
LHAQYNKAVAGRFIDECVNKGNLQVSAGLMARTAVLHRHCIPDAPAGLTALKGTEEVARLRSSVPDAQVTSEDMVAEGDRVAAPLTMCGS